jgi:hypothetical protein
MIIKLKYGNTNTYFVNESLIDRDYAGTLPALYREIKEKGIAVILDDGNCFVGDLEPIEFIDAYERNSALQKDWSQNSSYNSVTIYYDHYNEKRFR